MKILHLYYDIMNLYGDYANIRAVEKILKSSGAEVYIDRISLGEKAQLEDYDFIFIGSGTEKNRCVVLSDFSKYKSELEKYIESKKPILMTGNSFEMLGKSITLSDGLSVEGLGIFDFTVTEQDKKRNTGDVIYTADYLESPVVGFINKCSEIFGISSPLFSVEMGLADNNESKTEGLRHNNLFATHITGPVLIKNPHFLKYIANIILEPYAELTLNTDGLDYEEKGYAITLSELRKRQEEMG